MRRTILGLDIGKGSITAVIVQKQAKEFLTVKSLVIPFDKPEIQPSDINTGTLEAPLENTAPQELSLKTAQIEAATQTDKPGDQTVESYFERAISKLVDEISLDRTSEEISAVAISISSSLVSFRNITLPFSSPKKIRQVLAFELAPNLALADTAYISDFTKPDKAQGGSGTSILTASVPDAVLDAYFTPLKAMGLQPSLITIQGYVAADHVLTRTNKKNEAVVLIDHSNDHTTICLSSEQRILQVRSLGQTHSHDTLIQAIHQTVQGGNLKSCGNFVPERCIITSQGQESDALINALELTLPWPVEKAAMPEYPNALAAAVAQATSRPVLNFCRERYTKDSILKHHATNITVLLVFALMAFFSFMFKVNQDINDLENKVTMIDSAGIEIYKRNFPLNTRIVDPLMQMKVELEQIRQNSRLEATGTGASLTDQKGCVEILGELSNRIPPSIDVEIERLILNQRRLVLSGSTGNFNDIDRIKGLLEASEIFRQVEIQSAAADKTGNRVRFKFIIIQ
ncbi:MAG: PilN domain-containing protein [Desulfobacterium sp.]|jgi:general secretion pathway protein L|nr:PilN domain-containing protein [Desulfobacterium sp.]